MRSTFECANPILSVADMARSLRYYVDVLGFRNAEWGDGSFTLVTRPASARVRNVRCATPTTP